MSAKLSFALVSLMLCAAVSFTESGPRNPPSPIEQVGSSSSGEGVNPSSFSNALLGHDRR